MKLSQVGMPEDVLRVLQPAASLSKTALKHPTFNTLLLFVHKSALYHSENFFYYNFFVVMDSFFDKLNFLK